MNKATKNARREHLRLLLGCLLKFSSSPLDRLVACYAVGVSIDPSPWLHLGTLRATPDGALADGEDQWLLAHTPLLDRLQSALALEPSVKMAFIFGSNAKGTDTPDSDLDLVVDIDDDTTLYSGLHRRLVKALPMPIDLIPLSWIDPAYLSPLLEDARCVLDRTSWWVNLPQHKADALAANHAAYEREKTMRKRTPWSDQSFTELWAMTNQEYEAQAPPNGTWQGRQRPSPVLFEPPAID